MRVWLGGQPPDGGLVKASERYIKHNQYLSTGITGGVSAAYLLGFVCLLFYPFFTNLMNSQVSRVICYAIIVGGVALVLCIQIYQTTSIKFIIAREALLWTGLFFLSLFSNQNISHGSYSNTMYYASLILLMVMLTANTKWIGSYVKVLQTFTIIHAIITIICFINPEFYTSYIRPLFTQELITQAGYKSGLTSHYSTNGMYLAIGFILIACKNMMDKRETKGRVNKLLLALLSLALLLTTKRAHSLFSVAAIILVYLVLHSHRKFSSGFKLLCIIVFSAIALYIASYYVPELTTVVERFSDSDDMTNGRIPMFQLAWESFLQHPILGIGWGGYKYEYHLYLAPWTSYYQYLDAHNVYLQLLCETGVIGFTVFLLAAGKTLYGTIKLLLDAQKEKILLNINQSFFLAFSLGIQLFFLMYCVTGNPLYDLQMMFPYFLCCTVFYTIRYQVRKDNAKDTGLETKCYRNYRHID